MSDKPSKRNLLSHRHATNLKRKYEKEGYTTKVEEYTDENGHKHIRVVKDKKKDNN